MEIRDTIFFEGMLFLYIIGSAIDENLVGFQYKVYALLTYLIIKLIFYHFDSNVTKIIFLLGINTYIFSMAYFLEFNILLIMVPINIMQLSKSLSNENRLIVTFFTVVMCCTVLKVKIFVMVFFGVMSYGAVIFIENKNKRIISDKNRILELEEERYELGKNQSKFLEREKNIKIISKMEERNRISQNIHDTIGHTLAGSLMQLQALKIMVTEEGQKEILNRVISELKNGMDETRKVLKKIKPDNNENGLNTLKKMCMKLEDNELEIILKYNCHDDIPVHYWKIINANIKESFTNILKYSCASKVNVTFEEMNKFIKVEVKDNGKGCKNIKKGMGLRGIEERVDMIGGKLITHGDSGFSIIQIIPKENING
ncbi:sensor histidine kinase [Oceanirhabdus sp. W0125-5]|uniref:sensor histidine kinase n=1 Tax=Oceanirhabdus sp. W0125-5 TaxID=2999116 RepID=UPI0022F2F6D9|nr:histidine kinase [Oceanirhabdus sp. W0125-5]WBW98929.1 histidine kinase [Oceanirhabdus sp. W0125-5]